jgi:alpha-L-rhamnosidase
LSENGYSSEAYEILFREEFPSWLYAVQTGATTIWERWNSVLPDGSMKEPGDNSLNHYTYGSIVQWMYEHICGLTLTSPGFKTFRIRPEFSNRFTHVSMKYRSAMGTVETGWEKTDSGYRVNVTVPFDTTAVLELPGQQPITLTPGCLTVTV